MAESENGNESNEIIEQRTEPKKKLRSRIYMSVVKSKEHAIGVSITILPTEIYDELMDLQLKANALMDKCYQEGKTPDEFMEALVKMLKTNDVNNANFKTITVTKDDLNGGDERFARIRELMESGCGSGDDDNMKYPHSNNEDFDSRHYT